MFIQLAIATLATVGGIAVASTGGSKAKKAEGPPIIAQSTDEEKFIQYVELREDWKDSDHELTALKGLYQKCRS